MLLSAYAVCQAKSAAVVAEVMVTARRVNERLQDVPISVTAISGKDLEGKGVIDLKDVLASVPSLTFSNIERGQSKYNIRGIANSASAPMVAVQWAVLSGT